MKKMASIGLPFALAILLGVGSLVYAQSSGNFSASAIPATCSIGSGGALQGGTGIQVWSTDISTSNGKGVVLKITPSMVTGIFTKGSISTTISSASADKGIQVCVKVDGSGEGVLPQSCVVYDQRFQQVSSQLFSQIAACNTEVCTTTADCKTANATCINPNGLKGGGVCAVETTAACTTTADCEVDQVCVNPTEKEDSGLCNNVVGVANQSCNFDSISSMLSAHSFDFVVPVGIGKPHRVTVEWSVIGVNNTGTSFGYPYGSFNSQTLEACVGPGIVTVTQMKVFNNSGALLTY
jgi:hypothetical protein